MHEAADRVLLDAVAQGDADAWQQLVTSYSGRLLAFASRQLGRRSAEAEDLVQDTFVALLQGSQAAPQLRSLEAFLFVVLRRKIIDFRRRRKPENITESHWEARMVSPADTPSTVVLETEEALRSEEALADALARFLDALKREGRYREIMALELLFLTDRAGKDIGELLGFTPVQVSRLKHGALDFLREQVAACAMAPEASLATVWRNNLLTCLKRSTLGAFEMGLLDTDLAAYVRFHVEDFGCPCCLANIEDMRAESARLPELRAHILATSTPFLRRRT